MAAQDADAAHLQPTEIVEAENQNSEETPRTPTLPLRERETRLWATIEIKCPNPSLEALNAAFKGSKVLEPLDFDELEAHAALVFAGAKLAYERAQEVRNHHRDLLPHRLEDAHKNLELFTTRGLANTNYAIVVLLKQKRRETTGRPPQGFNQNMTNLKVTGESIRDAMKSLDMTAEAMERIIRARADELRTGEETPFRTANRPLRHSPRPDHSSERGHEFDPTRSTRFPITHAEHWVLSGLRDKPQFDHTEFRTRATDDWLAELTFLYHDCNHRPGVTVPLSQEAMCWYARSTMSLKTREYYDLVIGTMAMTDVLQANSVHGPGTVKDLLSRWTLDPVELDRRTAPLYFTSMYHPKQCSDFQQLLMGIFTAGLDPRSRHQEYQHFVRHGGRARDESPLTVALQLKDLSKKVPDTPQYQVYPEQNYLSMVQRMLSDHNFNRLVEHVDNFPVIGGRAAGLLDIANRAQKLWQTELANLHQAVANADQRRASAFRDPNARLTAAEWEALAAATDVNGSQPPPDEAFNAASGTVPPETNPATQEFINAVLGPAKTDWDAENADEDTIALADVPNPNQAQKLCWNCDSEGHIARECSRPRNADKIRQRVDQARRQRRLRMGPRPTYKDHSGQVFILG